MEVLSFLPCIINDWRPGSWLPTQYRVETDENGRHSTSRSFWLEHLELVFLHILPVEVAASGVSNVARTVETYSLAGDAASLAEKLLGDVETVFSSLGVGSGVWVVYFYGGTLS